MSLHSVYYLNDQELQVRGKSQLHDLEEIWCDAIAQVEVEDESRYLAHYNRFRLRNLSSLKRKRPAILLGFINNNHFPNFHSIGLLKVADIVSLTSVGESVGRIDRIQYHLIQDDMNAIRERLPQGFKPDLYWDIQAAHCHTHPLGISMAPFPSVASVCHVQHGPAVKTLSEMFDFVLPVGTMFDPGLSYGKATVVTEPFGINWASFHGWCGRSSQRRDVDVSVTFSPAVSPVYHGLREKVVSEMVELKRKWLGRFHVEIQSSLAKEDYEDLLSRSKISINVVGINGPFNYRSCEIINSGALLFQANVMEPGLEFGYDGILENGTHFVSFDTCDLEEKLIGYLDDQEHLEEMASSASSYLREKHSYENLFTSLLQKLSESGFQRDLSVESKEKDQFLLGSFLWHQHQKQDIQTLGACLLGEVLGKCTDESMFFANCLAVLPELLPSLGFDFLKNLVAERNSVIAESLDPSDLKQIAVQLFTFKIDHVATCYNFLSLSLELQWSPPEVLRSIAEQAFLNKNWEGFSSRWLLRPCRGIPNVDPEEFQKQRYQSFYLPLIKASDKEQEWIVYRDYLLTLLNIVVS